MNDDLEDQRSQRADIEDAIAPDGPSLTALCIQLEDAIQLWIKSMEETKAAEGVPDFWGLVSLGDDNSMACENALLHDSNLPAGRLDQIEAAKRLNGMFGKTYLVRCYLDEEIIVEEDR